MRTLDGCRLADTILAGHPGDRPALWVGTRSIDRRELADLVDAQAADLRFARRSVVVLSGEPSVGWVATYLALLQEGHVPLLAERHVADLAATWGAAAVARATRDGVVVEPTGRDQDDDAPDLHPDLALLLSTSGSTGSPKLVRLSQENLASNATAIARYLGIGSSDRGITSLPLHYCYGLSVLHAHLIAGGSVALTTASVVDPCFKAAARDAGVTTFSGVPHTFELLERAGVDRLLDLPSLRTITCAGGRLHPSAVVRWLDRCEPRGIDLVVMYGQTEATARMAYLPPDLARSHPGAIGVPIPGGSLRVEPVEGAPDGCGELVYAGPNVMMGYATEPAHLARGPELQELRTGDLGRYDAEAGLFEVVGRRSRFVKPLGVRVDLDRVERHVRSCLETTPAEDAVVSGDDDRVVVVAPGAHAPDVTAAVVDLTGLPPALVEVVVDQPVPRTSSGKVDHGAVRQLVEERAAATSDEHGSDGSVREVYEALLGRRVEDSQSFVDAGGDSLIYVECSLRLEGLLGVLPDDWHLLPVAQLEAAPRRRPRARLDTTALLRAIGICTVVATHMKLERLPGGAHLLLAVAGYNLSRFQLALRGTVQRIRAAGRTIVRTVAPTLGWALVTKALFGGYSLATLLLVNSYFGHPAHIDGRWHFWFVEAYVLIYVVVTVLLAVPGARRLDERFPYAVPLVLLLAALAISPGLDGNVMHGNLRFQAHGVAWFFALGWLVHRSTSVTTRVCTSVIVLATIPGFFGEAVRDWYIAVGIVLLVWLRAVPFPRRLARPVVAIGASSLWILVTHFRIWPELAERMPLALAFVLTIVAGVGIRAAVDGTTRAVRARFVRRSRAAAAQAPAESTGRGADVAVAYD